MMSLRSALAKIAILTAAATGLAACVATEPVGYYPAQSSYYSSSPGYYYAPAPRPTYQSFSFSYRDDDDRRRGGPRQHHNRGHNHGRHR